MGSENKKKIKDRDEKSNHHRYHPMEINLEKKKKKKIIRQNPPPGTAIDEPQLGMTKIHVIPSSDFGLKLGTSEEIPEYSVLLF